MMTLLFLLLAQLLTVIWMVAPVISNLWARKDDPRVTLKPGAWDEFLVVALIITLLAIHCYFGRVARRARASIMSGGWGEAEEEGLRDR
jgi:hypothetical protein